MTVVLSLMLSVKILSSSVRISDDSDLHLMVFCNVYMECLSIFVRTDIRSLS